MLNDKKNCTKEHIHPLVLGGAESDENLHQCVKIATKPVIA